MVLETQVFDEKKDVTEMLYSIFKDYNVGYDIGYDTNIRRIINFSQDAKKMKNCVFTRFHNIQQGKSAIYELTYDKLPYTVELKLKKGKPFLYEIGATMNENTKKLYEAKNYLQTELKKTQV